MMTTSKTRLIVECEGILKEFQVGRILEFHLRETVHKSGVMGCMGIYIDLDVLSVVQVFQQPTAGRQPFTDSVVENMRKRAHTPVPGRDQLDRGSV